MHYVIPGSSVLLVTKMDFNRIVSAEDLIRIKCHFSLHSGVLDCLGTFDHSENRHLRPLFL